MQKTFKIKKNKFLLKVFFITAFIFFIFPTITNADVLSPGDIDTCGELAAPGTYTLIADINVGSTTDCMIISASGVDIDVNGFELTGKITLQDNGGGSPIWEGDDTGWSGERVWVLNNYSHFTDSNITGYIIFNDDSSVANSDIVGDVIFNYNSYTDGNVAIIGNVVFNDGTALNEGGQITGNVIFNDSSYSEGDIVGNVVFDGMSASGIGNITGDVIFRCLSYRDGFVSIVGTVTYDLFCSDLSTKYWYSTSDTDWNNLNNWFDDENHTVQSSSLPDINYNTVLLAGSVSPIVDLDTWQTVATINSSEIGEVIFMSNNSQRSTANITGNAIFNGNSFIDSINNGNVVFGDDSYNVGYIFGNSVFNDNSSNQGVVTANTIFNNYSYNYNTVETAVFNDNSYNNYGTVESATFNNDSYNNGTVNGTATFYDNSYNLTSVLGDVFYESSVNGVISFFGDQTWGFVGGDSYGLDNVEISQWVFNDYSVNLATTTGIAIFNDGSVNSSGSVVFNAIFNSDSLNNGIIQNNATFNDNSLNNGIIQNNAIFTGNSTSNGTINGNAEIYYPVVRPFTANVLGIITYHDYPAFYFNDKDTLDGDWGNMLNWWINSSLTQPAPNLPTNSNDVYVQSNLTQNTSGSAIAYILSFENGAQNNIYIETSLATFYATSTNNTGTISGNAVFFGDLSENVGTITGTVTRLYAQPLTTVRNFLTDGGRNDWIIVAQGVAVNISNSIYNKATNIFKALNGGQFITGSNPAVTPQLIINFPTQGQVVTKWIPSIDWVDSTVCEYSYDNWVSTLSAGCNSAGSDISRPQAGSHTISLRAVDAQGSLSEKNITFTYDNAVPTYTMCGDDRMDEVTRPYYYLISDVNDTCYFDVSTELRGSATSTATSTTGGYTINGNIRNSDDTTSNVVLRNVNINGNVYNSDFGSNASIYSSTVTGDVSTEAGSGINSGNIIIASSTTGGIYSDGLNAAGNAGNAGNINIINSIVGNISAVGGNSLSCGTGGNGGLVSIQYSTHGTISNIGGLSNNTGCPSSTYSGGSTGGISTSGTGYGSAPSGSISAPSTSVNNSVPAYSGTVDKVFVEKIKSELFDKIENFKILNNSSKPSNIGDTVIPSPFKDFKAPTLLDFKQLPTNFLSNVSKFVLNKDNSLELFTVKSNNKSITTSIKYNKVNNTVTQTISVKTNQKLDITLNTKATTLNGTFNTQPITFNKGNISIITPSVPGTYLMKADKSNVTLSIQVTEPVKVEEVKKKGLWSWFKGLFK